MIQVYINEIPINEDYIITREQIDRKIDEIVESCSKRLLKRIFRGK